MKINNYAGDLPHKTRSLCPKCLKIIPALVFEKDGKVWIEKECPDHGKFKDLYWGSSKMYKKAKKFASRGIKLETFSVKKKNPVCPKDCGLCRIHKSHTALANLVLTNRCDLSCFYCFFYASRMGYVYEPTLEQIEEMVKILVNQKPVACNAIQLTGGEPTLREDLIDIIKMCKKYGVDHVQLNTNGIKLSNDLDLCKKIRSSGVNTLYLSFDGVTPKTNPKNHWEIPQLLENCREANLGVVLVPTIIKGLNDHEIGDILRFGFENNDVVRGVNFQPVSLVGRITNAEREKMRITIPEVIENIEKHTKGQIRADDFYPVPTVSSITDFVEAITKKPQYLLSAHFACGMATYVFNDNGKMIALPQFVDVEGLMEYLEEKSKEIKSGKSKFWVGLKMLKDINRFIDEKKKPKGFALSKILYNALMKHDYDALGDFHHKSLFVGMMHFQDLYNYDIERVERCCIHYAMTDGRIIPFCAFNVIPEWYRDKQQKSQGISFSEWEKKTGKRIKDDAYKRDIKKFENSDIYKKTYAGFI